MTYRDIYEKFMIEYDKANITSSYPSLTEYEVATILDKAYLALIAQKVTGNNPRKATLEVDTKAIEDLRPIMVTKPENKTSGNEQADNDFVYKIPSDLLYYIQSVLNRTISTKSIDGFRHSLEPTQIIPHQFADRFKATDSNLPWIKKPVCYMENDYIHVLVDSYKLKNDINDTLNVTYIKKPFGFINALIDDTEDEYYPDDEPGYTPPEDGDDDPPSGGEENPPSEGEDEGGFSYRCVPRLTEYTIEYNETSCTVDYIIQKVYSNGTADEVKTGTTEVLIITGENTSNEPQTYPISKKIDYNGEQLTLTVNVTQKGRPAEGGNAPSRGDYELSDPIIGTESTEFEDMITVTITNPNESGYIVYSTNGDDPKTVSFGGQWSALKSITIPIAWTCTLKAVCEKNGSFSNVVLCIYTKTNTGPEGILDPIITASDDTFTGVLSVTIHNPNVSKGYGMYVTVNGVKYGESGTGTNKYTTKETYTVNISETSEITAQCFWISNPSYSTNIVTKTYTKEQELLLKSYVHMRTTHCYGIGGFSLSQNNFPYYGDVNTHGSATHVMARTIQSYDWERGGGNEYLSVYDFLPYRYIRVKAVKFDNNGNAIGLLKSNEFTVNWGESFAYNKYKKPDNVVIERESKSFDQYEQIFKMTYDKIPASGGLNGGSFSSYALLMLYTIEDLDGNTIDDDVFVCRFDQQAEDITKWGDLYIRNGYMMDTMFNYDVDPENGMVQKELFVVQATLDQIKANTSFELNRMRDNKIYIHPNGCELYVGIKMSKYNETVIDTLTHKINNFAGTNCITFDENKNFKHANIYWIYVNAKQYNFNSDELLEDYPTTNYPLCLFLNSFDILSYPQSSENYFVTNIHVVWGKLKDSTATQSNIYSLSNTDLTKYTIDFTGKQFSMTNRIFNANNKVYIEFYTTFDPTGGYPQLSHSYTNDDGFTNETQVNATINTYVGEDSWKAFGYIRYICITTKYGKEYLIPNSGTIHNVEGMMKFIGMWTACKAPNTIKKIEVYVEPRN